MSNETKKMKLSHKISIGVVLLVAIVIGGTALGHQQLQKEGKIYPAWHTAPKATLPPPVKRTRLQRLKEKIKQKIFKKKSLPQHPPRRAVHHLYYWPKAMLAGIGLIIGGIVVVIVLIMLAPILGPILASFG